MVSLLSHFRSGNVSMNKIKAAHGCEPGECDRKKPTMVCLKRFLSRIEGSTVYHTCPEDCQFEQNNPLIKHKPLRIVAPAETWVCGRPILDIVDQKLGNSLWKEVLSRPLDFLKKNRSPTKDHLDRAVRSRKMYSITIGITPEDKVASQLKAFKSDLQEYGSLVAPLPANLVAFDVEGDIKVDMGRISSVPAKVHFGNGLTTFMEINFRIVKGTSVKCEVPDVLLDFLSDQNYVFVGNNLMSDVLLLNAAISIALGQDWEFSGRILDTAAIWVGIGGWDLETVGIWTQINMCTGGMLVKDFRLSCNEDWTRPFHRLGWEYNLYNLGDQYAVMCSAQVFLLAIVPSLFPSTEEILARTRQSVEGFFSHAVGVIVDNYAFVNIHHGVYQSVRSDAAVADTLTRSILCNSKMAKSQTLDQEKFLLQSFDQVSCATPQMIKVWPRGCPKIISDWDNSVSWLNDLFNVFSGTDMNFNSCKVKDISKELESITQEKKRIADERGLIEEEKAENEFEIVSDGDFESDSSEGSEYHLELNADPDELMEEQESTEPEPTEPESTEPETTVVEMEQLPVPRRLAIQAPRPEPRFNTSGYRPIPGELERLDRAGMIYMDVHHNNVETTVNATHWSEYLSIREMLYEVTKDDIFRLVRASPEKGLSWIRRSTPWGCTPRPTDFRFKNHRIYKRVVRIVEEEMPFIRIRHQHPQPRRYRQEGRPGTSQAGPRDIRSRLGRRQL